jgi:hypothetical protein
LRLLYGFIETIGKGVWFSIRFIFRNCKRLREFEEIDVTSICKAVESTVNNKEESF